MCNDTIYLGRDNAPPGLQQIASGKVRDIYEIDSDRLLFVTTDRISAFDVVMDDGIPHKGRVLTSIAQHWFGRTPDILPNHLLGTDLSEVDGLDSEWRERLDGRCMIVKRCEPDPIEWVVRGHIAGSGWKEYQQSGTVCGIPLPEGLGLAQELPEPILTPTTKFEAHDRPLSPAEAADLVGKERYEEGEAYVMALFERGTRELAKLGIRLADTKFELGTWNGKTLLIDEALTPDSSRFWAEDLYRVGISPPSYDKQILRDYLETLDWNKEYPAPELDAAVLSKVGMSYLEICQLITGSSPVEVTS
ncbi:MAG: phosphoribosylaminoimidazolesuccinocarboxamide synthase [Planctomycetes bacterium]|jgi:phosphoribosylaminoimidazole-succinocarboxamide synthase|nr:phosphoribosylaminoimidazolesuccinocarboxamide synthase [Planctomycetota bacterium]HJM56374.1 phosphoribosylaminoimidazolesuccinocarboxamide synthase [Planctomycetota bacterium]